VAQGVRRVLLNASDPHRTLFVDLPHVVKSATGNLTDAAITAALKELASAYPTMLDDLRGRMLKALGHEGDSFEELRRRAHTVLGLSGDLRLEAFVTRMTEFDGHQADMEAIAGLVLNKPARDWSDMDPSQAALELAELALRFRHVEILARVQGREPTQHAVAVVFGTGEAGRTAMKSLNLSETQRVVVRELAEKVLDMLKGSGMNGDLTLAALAEVGLRAMDNDEVQKVIGS